MNRKVNVQALSCFGDLATALDAKFFRYLETAIKWFKESVEAANITNPVNIQPIVDMLVLFKRTFMGNNLGRQQPGGVRGTPSRELPFRLRRHRSSVP